MSIAAHFKRLDEMKAKLASGAPPEDVWIRPPTSFGVREVAVEAGKAPAPRFVWVKSPGRRGDDVRGPAYIERWQAVRHAWRTWEEEEERP